MRKEVQKLSYKEIETLPQDVLKKEKLEIQLAIINTKEQLQNNSAETDIDGENYERLCKKLAHLKRLGSKMDLRLAEFNSIRSMAHINEDCVEQYNRVMKRLEIVQLLKPESKYALFHQVCHDFLDEDTCKMLTHEMFRRLSILKQEVNQR